MEAREGFRQLLTQCLEHVMDWHVLESISDSRTKPQLLTTIVLKEACAKNKNVGVRRLKLSLQLVQLARRETLIMYPPLRD